MNLINFITILIFPLLFVFANAKTNNAFWTQYQRFDRQLDFIDDLVNQNSEICTKIQIGSSHEGRPLVLVRIGVNSTDSKPSIWIESGIHAREWIAPAVATYLANYLVKSFNQGDRNVTDLLKYFDFYILPVLNPDGYEYSHTKDREWRKNRRPSRHSNCIGTDLNRNFNFQWNSTTGGSMDPCDTQYRGEAALSEPESKAEADYILKKMSGRIKAFLALHSYGQMWLHSWGYTTDVSPDSEDQKALAKIAVKALNRVSPNTAYVVQPASDLQPATGADDWAYGQAKIKYSYTVELRPSHKEFKIGFELPPEQIIPTGNETSAAIVALAQALKEGY